jgi:mRNA-degrading endonuclease YafQ of YafQ-DinJ toxin-antitoxin module
MTKASWCIHATSVAVCCGPSLPVLPAHGSLIHRVSRPVHGATHFGRFQVKKSAKRKSRQLPKTYNMLDELMASATQPMPVEYRTHQLTRMYQGLHSLETADEPTPDDWRVVSDAVNMLETLVVEMQVCEDGSGLLPDAIRGLAVAGQRHKREGKQLRLDGPGISAVRAVLASYADLLCALPARTMYRCHRLTEKRIHDILAGRKQPHSVEML